MKLETIKPRLKNYFLTILQKIRRNPILFAILLLYLAQSLFFSQILTFGSIPDETFHFTNSYLQSLDPLDPMIDETNLVWPETATMVREPFFYHFISGIIINLNIFEFSDLHFLRIFNIILSTITLLYIYKLAIDITRNKKISTFATFLMSQTSMFVFLSSGVSYDNFINLLTVMLLFYIHRLSKDFNIQNNLISFIIILIGSISKITFLPIAIMGVFIIIFLGLQNRKNVWSSISNIKLSIPPFRTIILSLLLFCLFILTINLYGINLIKYSSIIPGCTQLISHEECIQYSPSYKNAIQNRSLEGDEEHSISRRDVYDWQETMFERLYGVLGNRNINYYNFIYTRFNYLLLILLTLGSIVQVIKEHKKNTFEIILSIFSLLYILIIFYIFVSAFMRNGVWSGLQGRYILPVIPFIYIVISRIASSISNKLIITTIILLTIFSLYFGFYKIIENLPELATDSQRSQEWLNELVYERYTD